MAKVVKVTEPPEPVVPRTTFTLELSEGEAFQVWLLSWRSDTYSVDEAACYWFSQYDQDKFKRYYDGHMELFRTGGVGGMVKAYKQHIGETE